MPVLASAAHLALLTLGGAHASVSGLHSAGAEWSETGVWYGSRGRQRAVRRQCEQRRLTSPASCPLIIPLSALLQRLELC